MTVGGTPSAGGGGLAWSPSGRVRKGVAVSSVPLTVRSPRTGARRAGRPGVAASTRFAAPDPTGPGAERMRENLRLLGGTPSERRHRDSGS